MPGQSENVPSLFAERALLISRLSQENAGHLRILRQLNGIDILLAKNSNSLEFCNSRDELNIELENSRSRITALEKSVAKIDERIERLTEMENNNG